MAPGTSRTPNFSPEYSEERSDCGRKSRMRQIWTLTSGLGRPPWRKGCGRTPVTAGGKRTIDFSLTGIHTSAENDSNYPTSCKFFRDRLKRRGINAEPIAPEFCTQNPQHCIIPPSLWSHFDITSTCQEFQQPSSSQKPATATTTKSAGAPKLTLFLYLLSLFLTLNV